MVFIHTPIGEDQNINPICIGLVADGEECVQSVLECFVQPVSSSAPVMTAPRGTSDLYVMRASGVPAFRGLTYSL